MKYRLTEDWLEYKKGHVFTYHKEDWLIQNGSRKEDVSPMTLSLLLKTGILEEVKEEEWPRTGDFFFFVSDLSEKIKTLLLSLKK